MAMVNAKTCHYQVMERRKNDQTSSIKLSVVSIYVLIENWGAVVTMSKRWSCRFDNILMSSNLNLSLIFY